MCIRDRDIHAKGEDATVFINKKTQRIFSICQKEQADTYVNLPGAQALALYDKYQFQENNIQLQFIHPNPYNYRQFKNSFVSHLSIIDVLMHNGREGTNKLIKNYQLV